MKQNVKTNAMRILDSMGLDYDTASYTVDEEHLDAVHASLELGVSTDEVFKTIVMQGSSRQLYVFVVPAAYEVSLKKARELTGEKSIDSLPLRELQKMTGYIRGGCSPLGMIRKYPTFIEESAQLQERIYVSAGQRGIQLYLTPSDLAAACQATFESFI